MRKNSLLLLTMVLTVFLAGSVWGQMVLQVDDATYFIDTAGNVLTVSLTNDANVAALQFDMTFDPDCFTIDPAVVMSNISRTGPTRVRTRRAFPRSDSATCFISHRLRQRLRQL